MKKHTEVEKPYPTVSDSFDDGDEGAVLRVRAGAIWSDFVRSAPEKRDAGAPFLNSEGTVPLLDDMTGIRQWE